MKLPLLYSRTSKGQVQTWEITVDGSTFYTAEGIKGGAITTSKPTQCKAKNVGRANETTPEEQAIAEAKAKWQKKIDGGYFENEADIDTITTFWPMLAEKWKEYKDFVVEMLKKKTRVFVQPKLDGMRCIVRNDGMWSREGKPINSAPHIRKMLQPLFDQYPDLVLDGELYNHALKHNFDKLMSLAKKQKPTPAQLIESEQKLQYWVYDVAGCPTIETLEFERRAEAGRLMLRTIKSGGKVRWVHTYEVTSVEEIVTLFQKFIDEGFEGLMVRINVPYFRKRTKNLLKYKEFIDAEFPIWGIEDGNGDRAGIASTVYFTDERGEREFDGKKCWAAGVIGSHEYAAELFKNRDKYRGKPGTVVYFNLTPSGIPRFGKMKIVRDYE